MSLDQSIFGRSPPPRKNDVLFRAAESGTNACISHFHDVNLPYKNGFRIAAGRLALHVCETHSDQDSLVYPILYLYRHHLELVLKDIFRSSAQLLGRPLAAHDEGLLKRHDLVPLWEGIVPLLDSVCKVAGQVPLPAEDIEGVRSYLAQVKEHDPDGQRFRYATVPEKSPKKPKGPKRQVRSISNELRLVNIRIFACCMERLADYLDGLESWIAGILSTKMETQTGC